MDLTNSTIQPDCRFKRKVSLKMYVPGQFTHSNFCKVVTAMDYDEPFEYSHYEYVERMVAAYNAFAGVPTDQIRPALVRKQRAKIMIRKSN
jgi:hypothetical protein